MTIPQTENIANYIENTQSSVAASISGQWKGVLSEFFSTMFLVAFGCMSCIPIEGLPYNPPMYAPLAFGMAIMICIQIFGHISGALMNPFIAVQAVLWGRISIPVGIAYILAELAGASVGYGILVGVAPVDMAGDAVCLSLPSPMLNGLQAVGIEILLSAALSLVNCSVWDPVNENKQDSVPLKYALTIGGLALAGGPLTGGSMNPARSFGPALWSNRWDSHWIYWVGPFIGGIIPAIFYKYIWLQKKEIKLP
nr:aquaporin [Agriphila aeneociliella]